MSWSIGFTRRMSVVKLVFLDGRDYRISLMVGNG